ncbi:hypothetical protein BC941DRAFT_429659 [Chlamydoabsidia padenii]|nr:hypothetical protein BC941DRAFT_429659 [Chlamydoabsidia padenii]
MDKDTQRIEDDRMQQQRAMMEDEGTRAFATITPTYYDDPELCSSFTQSLSITPPNVSFTPDMPTTTNNTNDDPWAPPALLASTSTTDLKNDIEPAKQAAFADLIAQWHGARQEHTRKDPDDHFFDHVACEQRDIAFAGIGEPTTLSSFQWQQQDTLDNPWSS